MVQSYCKLREVQKKLVHITKKYYFWHGICKIVINEINDSKRYKNNLQANIIVS